ncbi:MAG TPA: DUF2961 domain-containing protein [Gemmataceae bacterium]|nr:DUF2961 domain-containing protein [Gemmataceae bacterium]
MRIRPLSLLVLLSALPAARATDKVTLSDLLQQMTDLSQLAEYPDPPYVSRQFSSYDRASETPGNDAWFANYDRGFPLYDGVVKDKTPYFKSVPTPMTTPDGYFAAGTKVGLAPAPTHKPIGNWVWAYATGPDGGPIDGNTPQGYIEKPGFTPDPQGHVLAEMDGPGCVVRIWSANPADAGKIHIYLDDAKDPVIEAPLADLLGGKWKTTKPAAQARDDQWTPFPDPIACERSRGFNLYFPIAYAKHCKVTIDKPDIYYHVDYRTYPKGTDVETFSLGKYAEAEADVSKAAEALGSDGEYHSGLRSIGMTVRPGKRERVNSITENREPWAVQLEIELAVEDDKDLPKALRSLVLIGTFDGAEKPQIWCPVGDFFGSAPGFNSYSSLPFRVFKNKRGWIDLQSFWWMPFKKSAVFELENFGETPVRADIDAHTLGYNWTDRSMYFHAKWRTSDMKTRPFHDWTYCDLKGKGVFVGDMLSIMNPVGAWWGEGDEKIFVDGEKFPSWFGTGSEDYYGYAWSDPTPFSHPYHNQTRCDGKGTGATFGLTSVNRFHILDAIPFEKSFRFDMECWHWDPNVTVNYAATSYWYARPGATDDFEPVDAKVLQHIPGPPPPYKIAGALEGESLKVIGKSSEFDLGTQAMREFGEDKWSGDAQLWGRPAKVGEFVDLALPVPADGKYKVVAYLTGARDYGIVQFSLDGKALGKPIDCFDPTRVVTTGPIDLGEVELKKGDATLRLTVTGTNAQSVGLRYMFGLDCVVLKPAAQ